MIRLDEAQRILWDAVEPLGAVELELGAAHARVLIDDVVADRDFPPTDRSAMDGYAVRSEDVAGEGLTLRVVGEVRAGQSTEGIRLAPGQALRIMTGAIVPPGADAVVMVEDTCENDAGDAVTLRSRSAPGKHIRKRGQDLRAGQPAVRSGVPIHAAEIAALASVGASRLRVFRPPVVHVLTTGDEIVEPDRSPLEHQVRNSNAPALLAQLRELDIDGRYLGIASDEAGDLDRAIHAGLRGDCLLITGGVSAGKYDLVVDALTAAGMQLLFHKIRMKPGKPIMAGRCGDCLVVGLPGNPVSTFVGFSVLVAPALRRMMGYRNWSNVTTGATLAEPLRAKPGRVIFHLARIEAGERGLLARPARTSGSGDVLSMSRANGFIVTPEEGATHEAGAPVPTLLWRDHHLR